MLFRSGERLAIIGSINDGLVYADQLATALLAWLQKEYPELLKERYQIQLKEDAYQTLEEICISRHCFLKGEAPDLMRASRLLMEDFRSGKIGRITLEYPEEWQ